ncbi:MAG: alpha/beta hydrolase [Alphaproteobacteria bacterium]|nr:alpha/beta hydrolase [Alphaproteobacteria bacterium]
MINLFRMFFVAAVGFVWCFSVDAVIWEFPNVEKSIKMGEIVSDDFYTKQELSLETERLLQHFTEFIEDFKKHPYDESCKLTRAEFIRQKRNGLFMALSGPLEDIKLVEDNVVKSEENGNEIPVRLYRDADKPTNDLIIFVHGGGWTQGNLETHDYLCRKLAKIIQKDVLAVDYRLSPENPHPCALNDVISVYKKFAKSDYDRLLLCGDSGGAHLCSAACIRIYEEKLKRPYATMLFYPALGNDFNSRSFQFFGSCLALTKAGTIAYTDNLAGGNCQAPENISNKYIFPVLQKDMAAFPKEIIVSSGYDVLFDGQLEHVKNMVESDRGEDVDWFICPGAAHGFMTYGKYYDELVTQVCEKIKVCLDKAGR